MSHERIRKSSEEIARICDWNINFIHDTGPRFISLVDIISLDEAVAKLKPFFYVTRIELGDVNIFYGSWECV